jgi:cobalt-zinc-cadmium efflux system membrane fusion protein
MSKLLFSLLLLIALPVRAQNPQINISQEQIDNLAIKLGNIVSGQQVPMLYAPARIVVPSYHEQLINVPQPGFLTQLHANIGDRVKKGQIMAQLHSPELVALQQQFLTAQSELHLASLAQGRDQKLLQAGVIAERRWQETQALHGSKAAIADEANQLLSMAGMSAVEIAQLIKTHKLSSQIQIRAPIDGVVLERMATLGSRLDLLAPLYRMADLSELWLEINVPQEKMPAVQLGNQVKIDDAAVSGKITLLGQSVDEDTQTILARALLTGKTDRLRVGQNLTAQIMLHSEQTAFKVPNTAIAQQNGQHFVFVRNTDGFAVTEIHILGKQANESLITGTLTGEEQIALQGSVALKANWLGLSGDD